MVTKNLYVMEDVAATLLHALQQANIQLAKSCIAELIHSKEHEFATKLVTFACILREPGQVPYEALLNQDLETLVYSFHTPFVLPNIEEERVQLPPTSDAECPQFPWKIYPHNWTQSQAFALWRTVTYALQKGHWEKAYRLTCPLLRESSNAIVDLLRTLQSDFATMLESTVFMPLAERVLKHALYAKTLILHTSKTPAKFHVREQGRVFTILSEALALWHLKPKPLGDLQGCPILIHQENASQYWKDLVQKFHITGKKTLKFKNDDDIEEFYTTYFPNDIPDEWSNEERCKSHGFPECEEHYENPWVPAFLLM